MSYFASINRWGYHRWNLQRIWPAFQKRPSTISTSKRNEAVVDTDTCQNEIEKKEEVKNWISYGFDSENRTDDRSTMHSLLFVGITLCGVLAGGFIWSYAPDYHLRDWSTREGFLELKRREAAGQLPIDPNFIPPEKIILPSDQELGDTEIII
ncbi:unnamed protein product [Ceutorhynchus assimilis]|uniref:NADH dehydrogenase [ubiquinone] 1 beta subcomplex subunit 11, mitochondrial n=1 Tax=Ceutorhynchus assimilis TaxID=467358 RepID=A0A9N9MRZ2_9CUCU|nr:unnamed protein product [Ceutorhynchus assimilis]